MARGRTCDKPLFEPTETPLTGAYMRHHGHNTKKISMNRSSASYTIQCTIWGVPTIYSSVALAAYWCIWYISRLKYLQCVSNGDIAVLHKAIDNKAPLNYMANYRMNFGDTLCAITTTYWYCLCRVFSPSFCWLYFQERHHDRTTCIYGTSAWHSRGQADTL